MKKLTLNKTEEESEVVKELKMTSYTKKNVISCTTFNSPCYQALDRNACGWSKTFRADS